MREAFALQKLLTFFQPKILANLGYLHLKFSKQEILKLSSPPSVSAKMAEKRGRIPIHLNVVCPLETAESK